MSLFGWFLVGLAGAGLAVLVLAFGITLVTVHKRGPNLPKAEGFSLDSAFDSVCTALGNLIFARFGGAP